MKPQITDIPTMPHLTLLNPHTSSETGLYIMQQIGSSYLSFGTNILDDANGSVVKALEHQFQRNSSSINWEVLRLWLNGKGRKPVTWATLVKVLREIEMDHLAHKIESYLSWNKTATPGEVKRSVMGAGYTNNVCLFSLCSLLVILLAVLIGLLLAR